MQIPKQCEKCMFYAVCAEQGIFQIDGECKYRVVIDDTCREALDEIRSE